MSAIKVHVSHDFVEMSVDAKIPFGDKVILAMVLAILLFPNPTVAIAGILSLTAANVDLKNKHDAYLANPSLLGALEVSETAWISVFTQDATYVDSIAHGNPASIDASGYNKTKSISVKATQPTTPVVKEASSVVTGGLDVENVPQHDADSFGGLVYTSDLTPVFNGNQVTFTMVNGTVTSQISFLISKSRKFSFRNLLSMVRMKLVTFASNAWGMSHPTNPTDKGIL